MIPVLVELGSLSRSLPMAILVIRSHARCRRFVYGVGPSDLRTSTEAHRRAAVPHCRFIPTATSAILECCASAVETPARRQNPACVIRPKNRGDVLGVFFFPVMSCPYRRAIYTKCCGADSGLGIEKSLLIQIPILIVSCFVSAQSWIHPVASRTCPLSKLKFQVVL